MKPIIVLMFCAQAAILLVTVYIVALRKPTGARPRPIWSSVAVSLLVVGIGSNTIAQDHVGARGADILEMIGAILIGMALMAGLLAFTEQRSGGQGKS